MGSGFSADAESLKDAARVNLGDLADGLRATKAALAPAERGTDAFVGGNNPGKVFENIVVAFDEAMHYLNRVLDDNIENVELSADALREIADRYTEADQEAAEGLPS